MIDSITVTTDNKASCPCPIYLPNAFTPNNDGLNDYFHPVADPLCAISDYHFIIVNRWARQYLKVPTPLPGGMANFWVYQLRWGRMYYLKYKSGVNNTELSMKGDVMLVR